MQKFIEDKYSIRISDFAEKFAKTGYREDVEYQDFWHFLVDYLTFSNGDIVNFSWEELKEGTDHDWQKEICDLFIAEFGTDYIDVMFSW